MPGRPIVLIEALDSLGAHEADARLRSCVLRHGGHPVRSLVVHCLPPVPSARVPGGHGRREWLGELAGALPDEPRALVVVAASGATAAAIASQLPVRLAARWWPTEVLDAAEPLQVAGRRCEPLFVRAPVTTDGRGTCRRFPALEQAVIAAPRLVERRSLWDGDYVLVPGPFADVEGPMALEAFAHVAATRHELDLVALAHPQPAFCALARRLGVGTRVHFAGPAPRQAEQTWLASASAALLAHEGPLSAGWVLRALAWGCPVLPVGRAPLARGLRQWLAGRGCLAAGSASHAGDPGPALECVLEGGRPVVVALGRGRAVAAGHEAAAVMAWPSGAADTGAEDTREVA